MACAAVLVAASVATGCAGTGGAGSAKAGTGDSPIAEEDERNPGDDAATGIGDAPTRPPKGSMEERLLAGDYEGVLAAYAADTTLHDDELATYRAAIAAAMPGHAAHDPRGATALFARLLERHPDTVYRSEAELVVDLLARQQELRAAIGRLDRELQQLKAIDLGQQPRDEP